MTDADPPTLRPADVDSTLVRAAVERRDPLPGTAGFAGRIDDKLVRDVLGRVPLFVDGGDSSRDDPSVGDRERERERECEQWAFTPTELENPTLVPAGTVASESGRERVWELPDPEPESDRDRALEAVARALETAVDAVRGRGTNDDDGDVAVAFSGGIDSALVAELLDAPLYVAGFEGSHDLEAARTAAAAMGREDDLTVVELAHADLERAVPRVARATGRTNAMDVQIALPLYLVAERASADGFDRLAVGQGADELFGGYEKVVHLDHRVEADTVRGAVREQILTLPEQLPRDVLALEAAGVEPVAPLLHDAVIEAALHLPTALLADESERKRALRLVAKEYEYLPEEVVDREKKAVQYGSLVARELDRLARRAGYKRRMDDHVTKYVESLLADAAADCDKA